MSTYCGYIFEIHHFLLSTFFSATDLPIPLPDLLASSVVGRNQRSEVRSRKSEDGSQWSGISGQESENVAPVAELSEGKPAETPSEIDRQRPENVALVRCAIGYQLSARSKVRGQWPEDSGQRKAENNARGECCADVVVAGSEAIGCLRVAAWAAAENVALLVISYQPISYRLSCLLTSDSFRAGVNGSRKRRPRCRHRGELAGGGFDRGEVLAQGGLGSDHGGGELRLEG